jgi:hypothetical protein
MTLAALGLVAPVFVREIECPHLDTLTQPVWIVPRSLTRGNQKSDGITAGSR